MGECEQDFDDSTEPTLDPGPGNEEAWQWFLEQFAQCGVVSEAADSANIHRSTVYVWTKASARCAREFAEARARADDVLRTAAKRRAVDGVLEPVFFQGKVCGYVRKFSDTMLARLLAAHCEEHKDESTIKLMGDKEQPVTFDVTALSSEQIAKLLELEKQLAELLG